MKFQHICLDHFIKLQMKFKHRRFDHFKQLQMKSPHLHLTFDIVDHSIHLTCLNGLSLDWFSSHLKYLTFRFHVVIDDSIFAFSGKP